MPASTVIRMVVRIAEAQGVCSACHRRSFGVAYRLHDIHASGRDEEHGIATCPACVATYGHNHAIIRALAAEEAGIVVRDRAGRPDTLDGTRARFAHLRSLVTSGRIQTPPPIPLEHFAPSAQPIPDHAAAG